VNLLVVKTNRPTPRDDAGENQGVQRDKIQQLGQVLRAEGGQGKKKQVNNFDFTMAKKKYNLYRNIVCYYHFKKRGKMGLPTGQNNPAREWGINQGREASSKKGGEGERWGTVNTQVASKGGKQWVLLKRGTKTRGQLPKG